MQQFTRAHPLVDAAQQLANTTHLLISIPPDELGCPVFDAHGAAIAGLRHLRWIGYLSSTNVYGDQAGGWVDEATPTEPSGERGRLRLVRDPRIGTAVEDELAFAFGGDVAAEARRRFEHRDLDALVLRLRFFGDRAGAGEPADASADDDDAFHLSGDVGKRSGFARPATTSAKSSSALSERMRE